MWSNLLIGAFLIYAVLYDTKLEDYKVPLKEIPWWILAISGFVTSFLGLFMYNDNTKIIFSGVGLLAIAKIMSIIEERKRLEAIRIKE